MRVTDDPGQQAGIADADLVQAVRSGEVMFVSVTELGSLTGLSPKTIYRLIGNGSLKASRFGRTIRVPVGAAREFLANGARSRARAGNSPPGHLTEGHQSMGVQWVRSSLSFANGNCVEVASLPGGGIGVRDSKDSGGPVLVFTPEEWNAFLGGARQGSLTPWAGHDRHGHPLRGVAAGNRLACAAITFRCDARVTSVPGAGPAGPPVSTAVRWGACRPRREEQAMTGPAAADDSHHPDAGDDAACWQEARRLRRAHPRWVIIWLAPAREYRAYNRLPGARRDTTLAAAAPDALAALIIKAEQALPRAQRHQQGQR